MRKINRKDNFQFSIFNFHSIFKFKILNFKFLIFTILALLLIYTRFVNIGWGLPYPMNPDERNMANAVQNLNCEIRNWKLEIRNCYNPHFFAYGQFPLYLGYLGVIVMKFFDGDLGMPVSFQEAVLSLRFISALASIITACVLFEITQLLVKRSSKFKYSILIIIFSPALIQFAHFGTTESLLILFYVSIIYSSLLYIQKRLLTTHYLLLASLFSGLALATKVSSLVYIIIPLLVLIFHSSKKFISYSIEFLFLTTILFILFSPHTMISFNEFLSSIQYESAVALGRIHVFYTRQFDQTIPVIFQLTKIFPYTLGLPAFLLGLLGFFFLSWKKKELNLLRVAFLVVFIPSSFMYAKWTRFMAPAFPILIIFAILFLYTIVIPHLMRNLLKFLWIPAFAGMTIILILSGVAYLSIYQNPDVRFQASQWIYKNIPTGSRILSETANVVDIPLLTTTYKVISFNFYDLDQDKKLQQELSYYLKNADYIIVPSRRIFKNNIRQYPLLDSYYQNLFSGKLGFNKVAEFSSYPTFKFQMEFPDEDAEETWTVFDHPVIRIYKKVRS